jgi:protein-S-isoprenylcysteine O-methyltransferase Ste14
MKELTTKEDWPFIPIMIFGFLSCILSLIDFIFIQQLPFQINLYFFIGVPFILLGGVIETQIRLALKKSGFRNIISTIRLKTINKHILITDGWFKYVRHPMYFGVIFQLIGISFIFTSFISIIPIIIVIIFILIRIPIEEKMLLEEFGKEYEQYKKKTKKLIPFIY